MIDADTLKKKVWKGQTGTQAYSSFMQQARKHWRPATGESGRASPVDNVLHACFPLLENLDRAVDEMRAEATAKAAKAKATAHAEKEVNAAMNPPAGKRGGAKKPRVRMQFPSSTTPFPFPTPAPHPLLLTSLVSRCRRAAALLAR